MIWDKYCHRYVTNRHMIRVHMNKLKSDIPDELQQRIQYELQKRKLHKVVKNDR